MVGEARRLKSGILVWSSETLLKESPKVIHAILIHHTRE
jgi:hypothetical protein